MSCALCDTHTDALASFRCQACGKLLCYDCVDETTPAGTTCLHCGGVVDHVDDGDQLAPEPAVPAHEAETLYSQESRGTPPPASAPRQTPPASEVGGWTPAALFAHHVAVPAATIAMVTALLFFLVDLRSVFLGPAAALKWVGFWFVTATVLTARYGKIAGGSLRSDRQGCYTLALAAVTLLVIVVSPWETRDSGASGTIFNGLIILGIWWYATALTRSLSLEGEAREPSRPKIFGLERLALERWQGHREDGPRLKLPTPARRSRPPGDPRAAVARLAAGALLIFAIAEPWILSGAPEVGVRGLAAMVAFLLATGVLLGASAAVGNFRRIRDAGGLPSAGAVPGRLAASAGLMVLVLALALAMPGLEYRGSGALRPQVARSPDPESQRVDEPGTPGDRARDPGGASGESPPDGAIEGEGPGEARQSDSAEGRSPGQLQADRRGQGSDPGRHSPPAGSGPAFSFLESLTALGQWLRIPFFIALAVLTFYGLWRLWPLLAALRWGPRLRDRLRRALERLKSLLSGWRTRPAEPPPADPFRDLDGLQALTPRDAVLAAYGRALEYFAIAGHPRAERQTPLEFQSSLRKTFRGEGSAALPLVESLTTIYLGAAYSQREVRAADRDTALAVLHRLRELPSDRGALQPSSST